VHVSFGKVIYRTIKRLPVFVSLLAIGIVAPFSAYAGGVIKDIEIEAIIRELTVPIFRAASLKPDDVNLYIVDDSRINAYVANGSNIFINTGLIGLSDEPDMLVGVLAHETGHITGGHLLKTEEEIFRANIKSTLGYILGIGAAALGSPEAAQAIVTGGGQIAERQLLKYTRQNENAADQSALVFLDKANYSAKGLLELMEYLMRMESTQYGELNPYTLSHPLTRERIAHIRSHLQQSDKGKEKSGITSAERARYKRAVIKLQAFLSPPQDTLKLFPATDQSDYARYGRAIAYYRIPDLVNAFANLDPLLKASPKDAFYNELKGQILFENGKIREALPFYNTANQLKPGEPLILIQLARTQLATEDKSLLDDAVKNFKQVVTKETDNVFAWRQLGIAYGKSGKIGLSNLALAEEAVLLKKKDDAKHFLTQAKATLPKGAPDFVRLRDLEVVVERM
jgi:predicted Zn-dependent protease